MIVGLMALSAKTGYIAPANKYVAVELLTSMRTFKMSCVGNTYEQRRFHNCKMFYKKKEEYVTQPVRGYGLSTGQFDGLSSWCPSSEQ